MYQRFCYKAGWFGMVMIILLLGIAGCKYPDEPKTVTLNKRYQIDIPSYMHQTQDLNPDAEIQYQNSFRNRYLLLFKEPQSSSLQAFADQRLQQLLEKVKDSVVSKSKDLEVNGIPAHENVVNAKVGDERIYYKLLFYEGKEHYYQLVIWTRDDKLAPFKQDIDKIVSSFRKRQGS